MNKQLQKIICIKNLTLLFFLSAFYACNVHSSENLEKTDVSRFSNVLAKEAAVRGTKFKDQLAQLETQKKRLNTELEEMSGQMTALKAKVATIKNEYTQNPTSAQSDQLDTCNKQIALLQKFKDELKNNIIVADKDGKVKLSDHSMVEVSKLTDDQLSDALKVRVEELKSFNQQSAKLLADTINTLNGIIFTGLTGRLKKMTDSIK